ncbi:glycosyltransferase family 2 protein [Nocardioides abyssi]|uniref:Glycosyltransferase n=1 Tax=Nocardioides abyssi TaxID=3058370 RepID=A0ABT8EZA9_9ACTN|nr:glycosyltransferase [Nocardioides abyssi]MDN4163301.1 glycosyltransferase [Nocardioides abyssi]
MKAELKSVSVVIATHSRIEPLADLLDDLRSQDYPAGLIEVVVVDSPQGEDCSEVVASARTKGLNVTRLLTDNNLACKRNCGARASRGQILVFLDDDLRIGIRFLAAHVSHQIELGGAVVSSSIRFPEEWVRESNFYRFRDAQHRLTAGPEDRSLPNPPHRVVAMSFSIPRTAFASLGGFDTGFRRYGGEDIDFGMRCASAGYELVTSMEAKSEHRESSATMRRYIAKIELASQSSAPRLVGKHPELRQLMTFQLSVPGSQARLKVRLARKFFRFANGLRIAGLVARLLDAVDKNPRLYANSAYRFVNAVALAASPREFCQDDNFMSSGTQ